MRISTVSAFVLLFGALRHAETRAQPGMPYGGSGGDDVIVATVTKVSGHKATNGKPPLVELKVHEILRGDPKVDRRQAIWQPPFFDRGFSGGAKAFTERYEKWKAEPMTSPKVGDKVILRGWPAGSVEKGKKRFVALFQTPYSEDARKTEIQWIQAEDKYLRDALAQMEAEQKKLLEARKQWRARVSPDDIRKYAGKRISSPLRKWFPTARRLSR
jgi:hypothetical protein